jgi:hypothetical protein
MNQVTHTCLGVRAVGLLEEAGEDQELIKLLKTGINKTSLGAWMPDLNDTKIGSGDIDNHVLKMKPMKTRDAYFVMPKAQLLKELGTKRKMYSYLLNDTTLDDNWWNTAYKAEPAPGQHLGNRANALSIAITDLLLLGDQDLSNLVPGNIKFYEDLAPTIRTKIEQAGLYFFMLSHFIADSCMPMHCDARKLNGFSSGLHHEWELHWSKQLPDLFEKQTILNTPLTSDEIIAESKKMDTAFHIHFDNTVPDLVEKTDIWKEVIMICRGSFTLSCIVSPLTTPYDINQEGKKFDEIYSTSTGKSLIESIDAVVMHDAVLNIAMVWKFIWGKFKKPNSKTNE